MSVTIHLPTILRGLTQQQKTVHVQANSILQVIRALEATYPGMQQRLMQGEQLHRYMNIYVNDQDIRFQQGLDSSVKDGDTVTILPAVAGG